MHDSIPPSLSEVATAAEAKGGRRMCCYKEVFGEGSVVRRKCWNKTGEATYEGVVSGSNGEKYNVQIDKKHKAEIKMTKIWK